MIRKRAHRSKLWPFGLGEPLDMGTLRGCLGALLFSAIATYLMWHTYDFLAWTREILGIDYTIDPQKQRWARLWARIIGGSSALASIVAMIMIPINRRRARKSAEGQWFDTQELNKADLEAGDAAEVPVNSDVSDNQIDRPRWNDEPQQPFGEPVNHRISVTPQPGNAQVEIKNGQISLVIKKPQG